MKLTKLFLVIIINVISLSTFIKSLDKGPIPLVQSIIGCGGFMILLFIFVRKEFVQ